MSTNTLIVSEIKTIKYCYGMENGGIADFLKYLFHTLNIVEKNNCKLILEITHPIKKYLKINNDYLSDQLYDKFHKITAIDRNKTISEILKEHNKLKIVSNDFYSFGINMELSNSYDFSQSTDKYYNLFDYIDFNEEIYNIINSYISDDYISIHARLGDKYLEIKPSCEYCINDDRNINPDICIKNISDIIKKNPNKKIYFFSDNNKFKNDMKTLFNELIIFNNDIINISNYYQNIDYDYYLKNVIIEFMIIMKSSEIHALNHSGFTCISSYISKNKLFKYF